MNWDIVTHIRFDISVRIVAIRYMFACHNLGRMRGSVGKCTNLADNRIFIVVPKESPRGRGKASRGDPNSISKQFS